MNVSIDNYVLITSYITVPATIIENEAVTTTSSNATSSNNATTSSSGGGGGMPSANTKSTADNKVR